MERRRPRTSRERRNRLNENLLMRRRNNPQDRLHIIERRHLQLSSEHTLPSQMTIWSKNELDNTNLPQ